MRPTPGKDRRCHLKPTRPQEQQAEGKADGKRNRQPSVYTRLIQNEGSKLRQEKGKYMDKLCGSYQTLADWIETDDIHDLNVLHVYIACINESLKTKDQLDEDVIREMHAQYMCNRAHGDTPNSVTYLAMAILRKAL